MDGRVLAFTALTCLRDHAVFGLAPALQAARKDPQRTLQGGGRAGTGAARQRVRSLLILGEVALSVVLLVGAGLLVRSFVALQQVRPGFDASRRAHLPARDAGGPLSQAERPADLRPRARAAAGRAARASEAGRHHLQAAAHRQRPALAVRLRRGHGAELGERDGRRPPGLARLLRRDEHPAPRGTAPSPGTMPSASRRSSSSTRRSPGRRGRDRAPWASSSSSGRPARPDNMAEVVGVVEHERSHDLDPRRPAAHLLPDGPADPGRARRRRGDRGDARRASPARRRRWSTRWTRTWRSPAWRRWRSICPRAWRRRGSACC